MPGCSTDDALAAMLHHAAAGEIPIMCFVGNRGCIQIHSGPVKTIKPMGPWINVLDETFHLHLRTRPHPRALGGAQADQDGHVTSLEAYDARRQDDHPVLRQAARRRGRARRLALPRREPAAHPRADRRLRTTSMLSVQSVLRRGARHRDRRRCSSAAPAATATEGIDVFPDTSRIAAIGGSVTEIVYALGEEDRLVARDSTSLYPRSGIHAARCRLHAGAVAGGRAVGQPDRHPRARRQRPARKRSMC